MYKQSAEQQFNECVKMSKIKQSPARMEPVRVFKPGFRSFMQLQLEPTNTTWLNGWRKN